MENTKELVDMGFELGKTLKDKNLEGVARARIHQMLQPCTKAEERDKNILEFAITCEKQIPFAIIDGEDKENNIRYYLTGIVNGLNSN